MWECIRDVAWRKSDWGLATEFISGGRRCDGQEVFGKLPFREREKSNFYDIILEVSKLLRLPHCNHAKACYFSTDSEYEKGHDIGDGFP